jgi:hypothetical protein
MNVVTVGVVTFEQSDGLSFESAEDDVGTQQEMRCVDVFEASGRSPRRHDLHRTVDATCPIEYQRRRAIRQRLNLAGAHVTMLLTISHHNAELVRVALNRVLLSVHRTSVEHCNSGEAMFRLRGHGEKDLRGRRPSQ